MPLLTGDELAALETLSRTRRAANEAKLERYYEGTQRLDLLGLAVPPDLRRFETCVNWPRTVVDTVDDRLDVRALMLPGVDVSDPSLMEGWDYNNMTSEASLAHKDAMIFGHSFVSVGTNDEDAEHPLIVPEPTREMVATVNPAKRRLLSAGRFYDTNATGAAVTNAATLYLPNATVWVERASGGWQVIERDDHGLGRPPVVMFLNRRRAGNWHGVSEMADVIPLTDAAARALTNLQVAAETHSVPQKWVLGMSKGDFVDREGQPIPAWQSYFSAIWASGNANAKVGQFTASDLSNFHNTVNHYAALVAGVTGLPMRYFGQNTANPPSADGIRADESRLVKNAERKQAAWGDQWGRVGALYLRLQTGEWADNGNRIRVEWADAGTPTYGAKVDGVQKLTGGKAIMSVEGAWDELGWSEARKARERDYLASEATDPVLERIARDLTAPAGTASPAPAPSA